MTPNFSQSYQDAEQRFLKWKNVDPFPQIKPALLNSADIMDYVAATGMVYPFYVERGGKKKLKPASYEVDLLGEVMFWNEDGEKIQRQIKLGEEFILRRNSIAFIQVEPRFQIPDYIALRFNLKILHVYRGILLGTGPLVDPGFQGSLYIPLHNLTDNDYVFKGGEGLIWMEFTKVSWPPPSPTVTHETEEPERKGDFSRFPEEKIQRQTLQDYLSRASPHKPIRSSIPLEFQNASRSAKDALSSADKASSDAARMRRQITIGGSIALVATIAVLFTLWFQAATFVSDVQKLVASDRQGVAQEITRLKAVIDSIRNDVSAENKATAREIQELKAVWKEELGSMKRELNGLEKELKK